MFQYSDSEAFFGSIGFYLIIFNLRQGSVDSLYFSPIAFSISVSIREVNLLHKKALFLTAELCLFKYQVFFLFFFLSRSLNTVI